MASYARSYENGIEKHELIFRGKKFGYSMLPTRFGREGNNDCLEYQVNEAFPDLSIETLKNIGVDMLSCESDDGILEILEELDCYEHQQN